MDYFQTRDSAKLAYHYEDKNTDTLVLIHGALISSAEWQPQLGALHDHSYLLVDLRGHGQSDRAGHSYTVAKFADDIQQLIVHLGLNKIILCGHSLGGMVAQQLTVQYPNLIHKLVLVDTSFGVRSTLMEGFLTKMTALFIDYTPVAWQAKLFANQLGKHTVKVREYVLEEINQQDQKNYREIWKAVTGFNGYQQLRSISCPTLIVVGELNRQTHQQANVMNERISNSELVYIDHAGHMLNWDNPVMFNQVLLSFL